MLVVEASTPTKKGLSGSGWMRSVAWVKSFFKMYIACCCWIPGQRLGPLLGEVCQGDGNGTEDLNEAVIEICKSKKYMEFLDCGWNWPIAHSLHLPLVQMDAILTDGVAKELN